MEKGRQSLQRQVEEHTEDKYLKGMIEQGIAALLGEMQQGKSDRLIAYLAFTARFHRYSPYNQLLIYMQCPQATRVAGYRTWQQLGYQVARGQKAIRILAPHTYTRRNEDTDEDEQALYFVSVPVFDASQLANADERPLPEFWTPLEDDQQELTACLERAITDDGIDLSESDYLGTVQGFSAHGEIVIKAGLDSRRRFLVLVHEYAHELLHWDEHGQRQAKRVKECHAEAVSFVVASHFGIHNPFSSDYLQQWGNSPSDLLAELNTIKRTAAHIIDRIKAPLNAMEGGD